MNRVREAINVGNKILKSIEEIPEEGQEFAYSIEEKTINIVSWIEENNRVTEKQETALDNMLGGLEKWLS